MFEEMDKVKTKEDLIGVTLLNRVWNRIVDCRTEMPSAKEELVSDLGWKHFGSGWWSVVDVGYSVGDWWEGKELPDGGRD